MGGGTNLKIRNPQIWLLLRAKKHRFQGTKTFKVDDDKDNVKYTTEEVDELGLDEVIEELEQWLEEKESKGEKVEVDDKDDEDVMDFLDKIDFDYLVKLK